MRLRDMSEVQGGAMSDYEGWCDTCDEFACVCNLCYRCGDPKADYEGPDGEAWCVACYSAWCDYEFERCRSDK